jgi:hypothetical protein
MPRLGGMGLRGPQIVMNSKNHIRAVRYRQLALAEPDRAKADVLLKIADEAERDVLCTVDWWHSEIPRTRPRPPNLSFPPIAAAVKPLGVVAAAESGAIARPPVRFPVGGYFGEPERALAAAPRVGAGPCVPLT